MGGAEQAGVKQAGKNMMTRLARIILALFAPLLLTGCLVTPGAFVSTLDVRADRGFTFTYKGEVLAFDFANAMARGMKGADGSANGGNSDDSDDIGNSSDSMYQPIAFAAARQRAKPGKNPAPTPGPEEDFTHPAPDAGKMTAIAEALSKEHGYRSVRYVGGNKFEIDYAISGTLDHGFIYPFNIDAQILFPFVAIELRGPDRIRIKAPGYANSQAKSQSAGMGGSQSEEMEQALNGTFTLTTDAEIVSQNQEDGTSIVPNGRRIVWKVNPLTKDEPTAVLKLNPAQ